MESLWKVTDLMQKLNISRSAAHRLVKDPGFPPAVRIGGKMIRWSPSAIQAWLAGSIIDKTTTGAHQGAINKENSYETQEAM